MIENQQILEAVDLEEINSAWHLEIRDVEQNRRPQPFYARSVKVDLPRFEEENVLQWIFQVERFFKYYGVTDASRLEISSIHFDGPVVPWF